MHYIIQENVFREQHYNIIEESIKRLGFPYTKVRLFPAPFDKIVDLSIIPEDNNFNVDDLHSELVTEFAWKNAVAKQKMIDDSSIEELKILRYGLDKNMSTGKGSWIDYIKVVISKKIEEEREDKLNELGI
jgi:hypothetical protein